jgi:hypothetical protein
MRRFIFIVAGFAIASSPVFAQDPEESAEPTEVSDEQPATQDANGAKTLSGMSILGNEETPKSLVIVPWKSSEMGDELSLSDTLDDRAKPVDKEVFLRELRFYEIRAEK